MLSHFFLPQRRPFFCLCGFEGCRRKLRGLDRPSPLWIIHIFLLEPRAAPKVYNERAETDNGEPLLALLEDQKDDADHQLSASLQLLPRVVLS